MSLTLVETALTLNDEYPGNVNLRCSSQDIRDTVRFYFNFTRL